MATGSHRKGLGQDQRLFWLWSGRMKAKRPTRILRQQSRWDDDDIKLEILGMLSRKITILESKIGRAWWLVIYGHSRRRLCHLLSSETEKEERVWEATKFIFWTYWIWGTNVTVNSQSERWGVFSHWSRWQ